MSPTRDTARGTAKVLVVAPWGIDSACEDPMDIQLIKFTGWGDVMAKPQSAVVFGQY
jgi:hypothetical protein